MGRNSLAPERRQQIIAVTIRAIAIHGARGTTLERVAEMANMARGHIRHFAGNRDKLITDAAKVFYFGEEAIDEKNIALLAAKTPMIWPGTSVSELLDFLFGVFGEPGSKNAAAFSFHDASRSMPAVHEIVHHALFGMQQSILEILEREYPRASAQDRRQLASTLTSMAIGNSFMMDLERSDERMADALSSAKHLINELANGSVAP